MSLPPKTSMAGLLVASALAVAPVVAQPLPRTVLAYTGQIAPEAGGATFLLLFQPTITADGDVAFRAELTGAGVSGTNQKGIWRQDGGGPPNLFLRAGDAVPPLPSTLSWSTTLGDPNAKTVFGDARVGFFWRVLDSGPGPDRDSLWLEQAAGLREVATQGGAAPGIAGATFASLPTVDLEISEEGELLFVASVTGGGVTTANDNGLWLDDGVSTTLVAREGSPAPGFPAGTLFPTLQSPQSRLSPGGIVTFWANPFVPSLGFSQTGIWSNRGGSLAAVQLQGQSAPGLGGGETAGPGTPYANRAGQVAFLATISGGAAGTGLWISNPGGDLALAYRAPASSPPFQLSGSQPFLADNGTFYTITNTFSSGATRQALVAISPSGWREVVHVGERVAGLNAGITYTLFDQYLVNANGLVALRATIAGPGVTTANNKVLVAQGADRRFHLVARTGDSLEVSPGLFRTVASLLLTQITGGGPGTLRGFADSGELVWYAGTGGISSAIVVTELGVPPPVSLVALETTQVIQNWKGTIDLVEGKQTWVRAFFESTSEVEIHPRLRARPAGGGPELPYSPLAPDDVDGSRALVDAVSQRGSLGSSTEWRLPVEWTLGSVELEVELLDEPLGCLEAAGPTPSDCRHTAEFKITEARPSIRFVSVEYQDAVRGPTVVSPALRLELAQRLVSVFPVDGIIWSGSVAHWPGVVPPEIDTCFLYKWIEARRLLDGCTEFCKTVYYGAVLRDGVHGCARFGGWAGAGYMPPSSTAVGRHAHSHEVAHSLFQQHTWDPTRPALPNGHLQGFCGEEVFPEDSPQEFPYIFEINGQRRPVLGPMASGEDDKIYGFDTLLRRAVEPDKFFDMMSYCQVAPVHLWPSQFTYFQLQAAIWGRWTVPGRPSGPPLGPGTQLLVHGWIDPDAGTATFDPFLELPSSGVLPAPDPGPYTLRVHRAGGGTEDLSFAPDSLVAEFETPTGRPFFLAVSDPSTIDSLEVLEGETPLANRSASAHAPIVQVTTPNGGEVLDQPTVNVAWSASDLDGDPLTFVVQFSADGGTTWTTLETNLAATSVTVARSALSGTNDGRFRVQASDGLRTAIDASDGAFAVEDNAPEVAIVLPDEGHLFFDGQTLTLEAMTLDAEDGQLTGAALAWNSDLDGALGTGSPLTIAVDALAEGVHTITLSAEDSAGNVAEAQIRILVDQPPLLFEDDFESAGTSRWIASP